MMFHSSHVRMPNRRRQPRCGFRSFMPSTSFNRPDSKEPLRRGILFSSVAFVLLLIGAMLTWLGLNEPFSNNISMTGPLLIAIALLMLLLSLRQFMLARKRNRAITGTVQMDTVSTGGVTAVVVDDEDSNRAATIVVEAWDVEEPINDEIRNPGDLAPPAYTDISQSCSSMCPSFVSHDDHEAPPTYEETCGVVYPSSSEHSLSQHGSCHNSAQGSRRSSLQPNPPAYVSSHVDCDGVESVPMEAWSRNPDSPRNSLLSPVNGVALMAQAAVRRQLQVPPPLTLTDSSDQPTMPLPSSSLARNSGNANGRSLSPEDLSLSPLGNRGNSGRLAATAPPTPVPSGIAQSGMRDLDQTWSRRSFSSIPSYTCLLSKSGEVSAHVFDTSSIIQGMMPSTGQQSGSERQESEEKAGEALSPTAVIPSFSIPCASSDLLPAASAIPARSHSLTSVLPLRQGVPYNLHLTQKQTVSPSREHLISTPLLPSPHTCTISTQQQQFSENQHPHGQPKQHTSLQQQAAHARANTTSASLYTSSPRSNIHSQSQEHLESSSSCGEKKCRQLVKGSSVGDASCRSYSPSELHLRSHSLNHPLEVSVDAAEALCRCPVGDLQENTESKQCGGGGRNLDLALQTNLSAQESCTPGLSAQDIQETI